jgi:hypothetical protein
LYQWGRAADGHQCRNSATTATLSSTDQPGHGNFILSQNSPYDWRNPQNTNLWQGVNGVNNPCPSGYRLPTSSEFEQELLSWSSQDSTGAITSVLKLPLAGIRSNGDGSIFFTNSDAYYWTSSIEYSNSQAMYFYSVWSGMLVRSRGIAQSVRCIKE